MTLIRPLQGMPENIAYPLGERGLRQDYGARPAYQCNDYLAWIARAKRLAAQMKYIDQTLSELGAGSVYTKMRHAPPER